MEHAEKDGLSPLASTPSEEEAQRPSVPRTPPRVWPPMSPADMGRVVRRLKATAERLRDVAPLPAKGVG